jgi:hypothetical protein
MAKDSGNGPKRTSRAKEDQPPERRTCATEQIHLQLLLEDPEYGRRRAAIEDQAWAAARSSNPVARSGCTRIPVVVHVVHRTDTENISKAQIDSQIAVLNADFRKKNADVANVPTAFTPLAADARLEFALATVGPDGKPTDGITRRRTTVNGFGYTGNPVKSSSTGGTDPWPTDRYLNVWVCRLTGGLLGYAQFPGGPAATDGVVCTFTAFGTTGTAAAPFDRGRTTTHEIGHWLNLRHIWGDVLGCNGNDFVADTPNQHSPNTGKPTFPRISCDNGPNGDMFMNYMDYVDDDTMVMFTTGQVTRMHACLDGARASIGTTIDCGPKLKFADEPVTLKFRDDHIATLKFRDDLTTLKFRDDPIGTLKFADDITTSALQDAIQTTKAVDDVKTPGLDKMPGGEVIDPTVNPAVNPVINVNLGSSPTPNVLGVSGGAAPFVLATPHHSAAWMRSHPGAQASYLDALEQRLGEYEEALQHYATAEESGELSDEDRQELEEIYAEYQQLGEEHQRLRGGGS